MTDELDRAFLLEDPVAPSPRFLASVMEAVRREAALRVAVPFPWRRLGAAAVAGAICAAVTALALMAAVGGSGAAATRLNDAMGFMSTDGIVWATVAFTVTLLIIHLSVELSAD